MFPKFNHVGESAVLLEIDEVLGPAINRRVLSFMIHKLLQKTL